MAETGNEKTLDAREFAERFNELSAETDVLKGEYRASVTEGSDCGRNAEDRGLLQRIRGREEILNAFAAFVVVQTGEPLTPPTDL